ncbi:MAG: peptidoglycan binding domain-containing protein, partial [Clostridium sp.]
SQFNIGAKDATLKRENGAFRVEPGQTGYQIDVTASTDAIYQYLNTEWNHAACAIDLITKVAQPRGTEEELKQVKDVLG